MKRGSLEKKSLARHLSANAVRKRSSRKTKTLQGPVLSAIYETLSSTADVPRNRWPLFDGVGKCLDGVAAIERDPSTRLFVGIDSGAPDIVVLGYDPADLEMIIAESAPIFMRTQKQSLSAPDQIARAVSQTIIVSLARKPALLDQLRRFTVNGGMAALAIVTGPNGAAIAVSLPPWARSFGNCSGTA